ATGIDHARSTLGRNSAQREIVSACLQVLDSVLAPHSAAYVSGPVETGRLHYEAHLGQLPAEVDIKQINADRLSRVARELRQSLSCPVLDPARVAIAVWSSEEHLEFFLEVIR